MKDYDVKKLALVLALQAEIEGMKAENKYREMLGHTIAYNEGHFQEMAEKIRGVAYSCDNKERE